MYTSIGQSLAPSTVLSSLITIRSRLNSGISEWWKDGRWVQRETIVGLVRSLMSRITAP